MSGTKIIKAVFKRDNQQDDLNRVLHEFKNIGKLTYDSKISVNSSDQKRTYVVKTKVTKIFEQDTKFFNDVELSFVFDDEVDHPRHKEYDIIVYSEEHNCSRNVLISIILREMCNQKFYIGVLTHDFKILFYTNEDIMVINNILFGYNTYKNFVVRESKDEVVTKLSGILKSRRVECNEEISSLKEKINIVKDNKFIYQELRAQLKKELHV